MSQGLEALIARSRAGDRAAGEQLIVENSGLIWSIARRYFGRGVDPDDLYQLGCLGFLKAVEGYDTTFGTQFSTYAVPKIAGEIRRFLRDDGSVKVSREDGFTLENVLTDSDTEEQLVERIALREAIGKLPEREALVINLRYFHGLTQERVARVLQVSQVQVSRIEKKALGHLREMM